MCPTHVRLLVDVPEYGLTKGTTLLVNGWGESGGYSVSFRGRKGWISGRECQPIETSGSR